MMHGTTFLENLSWKNAQHSTALSLHTVVNKIYYSMRKSRSSDYSNVVKLLHYILRLDLVRFLK